MRNKIIIAIFVFTILGIFLSSSAFAEDSATSGGQIKTTTSNNTNSFFNIDEINKLIKEASSSANRSQVQLQNIIKAADEMIANRITSLNNLNTRIQGDTKLTVDEKASLTADVTTAITGLNTLKAKIDADTDVATAKADTKQIVTNFYIYARLEPKMRIFITLNNLQTTITNLQNLVPQIQSLITTLNSQGKDTSDISLLLNDISAQLTAAQTTITNDAASINGITDSTGSADSTFNKVKTDINGLVKDNFGKIRTDFNKMRMDFKSLITGESSHNASSSANPR